MNAADFDKLSDTEKEHFYWCSKCRQFVDKRELRDVIFTRRTTSQRLVSQESSGNQFRNVLPVVRFAPESFFDCRMANDAAMMAFAYSKREFIAIRGNAIILIRVYGESANVITDTNKAIQRV